MKSIQRLFLFPWIAAALLAATVATPAAAQQAGGTLVMVINPEPANLASHLSSGAVTQMAATKVYDGLLEYDLDLSPIPSLATEWAVSDDGRTITFNLREGVKWHDGKPFTSADVQYSIMEVLKNLHPRGNQTFRFVQAVETPDPMTAVLKLDQPYAPLMQALSADESPIVPRHLYEGTEAATNPYNNKPVGTGAFVFKEWVRGSHLVFDKNSDYWRSGRPYLDRLVIRFIGDASTRVAAVEKGEVHVAANGTIPSEEIRRLDGLDHVTVQLRGHEAYSPIMMFEINNRRPPLDQAKVRKALAHGLDRRFIIDNIFAGYGKIATGPIPSTHTRYYTSGVYEYDYDPEKAERLLDEAGLAPDAEGVRFEITHDMGPFRVELRRMGEYVKEALSEIGVRVNLRLEDVPTYLRRVYTDYDFDLTSTWFISLADPAMGVQRIYWSKNIRPGVSFSNASGYANADADQLWEQAAAEVDDAKRAELYRQVQTIVVDEIPVIWLMEMPDAVASNTKVHDLFTSPQGLRAGLYDTWIEE